MSDYEVQTFIDTERLQVDVQIDPTDLDNMMIRHPALMVHYSIQVVKAKKQFDRFTNRLSILEAKLDKHYRAEFANEGKKATEAQIRNAITDNSAYKSMQQRVLDAQEHYRLCLVAEKAFDQRKDLILEIARDRRKEKEGQMRVTEQSTLADTVRGMLSSK